MFGGEYPVSPEQVAFYEENGYVRFDNVLDKDEVEALRADLAEAKAKKNVYARDLAGGDGAGGGDDKILQMLNLWERFDGARDYILGGRIARMAKALTKSPTIHLYHDQALIKEPGPSAPSPWHQDQPYWPSKEWGMLSCWMALDDVTIERGCMQFIPGSHKWGEFPPISFEGEGKALKEYMSEEQLAAWNPVPVEMPAGSCTFHHGLCFHYTNANTTDHVRRALVAIFIPEGITYAADEKMDNPFAESITSKKGEPLRGTRFPELATETTTGK